MHSVNQNSQLSLKFMPDLSQSPLIHTLELRVRYQETDGQGHVHHSNYLNYFEVARTEMLRTWGHSYREMEESGMMLVIVHAECDYQSAAKFDDLLTIETRLEKAKGVRITHQYKITRDDQIICTGHTTVACVNKHGKPQRLPEWLRVSDKATAI